MMKILDYKGLATLTAALNDRERDMSERVRVLEEREDCEAMTPAEVDEMFDDIGIDFTEPLTVATMHN